MRPSRRAVLAAAAAGGLGVLAGCSQPPAAGASGRALAPGGGSEADEVTGPFDPRRAAGSTVNVLLVDSVPARVLRDDLASFTAATGVLVRITVLPEAQYYDRVTTELVSGLPDVDVFATGTQGVWQFAPPGWVEDLDPWLGNPSATAAEHDADDVLPQLTDSLRWSGVLGEPVGTGGRWAAPWWWESHVLAYRADVLARLGLRPPETFAQLEEVAEAAATHLAAERPGEGYGLAVPGARSWATVSAGLMTQFTREGGEDFTVSRGHLVAAVDSEASIQFHRRWTALVRGTGSPRWAEHTARNCGFDLGQGRAAMVFDATSVGLAQDVAGASPVAGTLAWTPGPPGPDGALTSSLGVTGLAISSRSQRKLASWLFVQWATGTEHTRRAALRGCADPVRASVLDSAPYRSAMGVHRGYLETLDAARTSARTTSTPQPSSFFTGTAWASALQDMVAGDAVKATLTRLADRMRSRS